MPLKAFQKKYLKSLAHDMQANIQIGKNGLTPEVMKRIQKDLMDHELIKVKISDSETLPVKEALALVLAECGGEVIKVIGKTFVLYRENPENEKSYFKACGKFGSKDRLYPAAKKS